MVGRSASRPWLRVVLLTSLSAAVVHLTLAGTLPTTLPSTRPVPSAIQIAQATRHLDELLHRDGSTRTASSLLKEARSTTTDPALRYVAALRAMELAAAEPNPPLALDALSELTSAYPCDDVLLKTQLVSRLARAKAFDPAGFLSIRYLDESLAQHRLSEARRFAALLSSTRKDLGPTLVPIVDEVLTDYAFATKEALATTRPASQPAATPLFACLYQGQWEAQLPQLAQSSTDLAPLAQADLAATDPANRLQAAEAWWNAGQSRGGRTGARICSRAVEIYLQTLKQTDGVHRRLILSRIASHQRSNLRWQGLLPGLQREVWRTTSTDSPIRTISTTPTIEKSTTDPQIPKSNAHARYSGLFLADLPGRYELIFTGGSSLKVTIDGKLLLNDEAASRKRSGLTVAVPLTPGIHPLEIEVSSNSSRPHLKLDWLPPYSGEPAPIPADIFYHDLLQTRPANP